MPKIYLAGKIRANGWRHELYPGLRSKPAFPLTMDETRPFPHLAPQIGGLIRNGFELVGPYFVGDDHGCLHGDNTHGLGAYGDPDTARDTCGSYYTPSQMRVLGWCIQWLKRADVIFAWIDHPSAFGAIYELGLAKALNIPVYTAVSSHVPMLADDLWLVRAGADQSIVADTVQYAWHSFVTWWNGVSFDAVPTHD